MTNAWLLNEATGLSFHWGFLLLLGIAFLPTLVFANARVVPSAVWEWFVITIGWATYLGVAGFVVTLAWKFVSR